MGTRTRPAGQKSTRNAESRKWYAANRERSLKMHGEWRRANPDYWIERELRLKYGLTKCAYDVMSEAQGGACAICGRPPGKKRLAVDHDHATGAIRALLCFSCNSTLGRFSDSPDLLRKAAAYLERHGK